MFKSPSRPFNLSPFQFMELMRLKRITDQGGISVAEFPSIYINIRCNVFEGSNVVKGLMKSPIQFPQNHDPRGKRNPGSSVYLEMDRI